MLFKNLWSVFWGFWTWIFILTPNEFSSHQALLSPKGNVLGNKVRRKSPRKTIKGTSVSWTFESRAGRSRENQGHGRTAHRAQTDLMIWTPYSLHVGTRLSSFRKPERKVSWLSQLTDKLMCRTNLSISSHRSGKKALKMGFSWMLSWLKLFYYSSTSLLQ